MADPTHKRMVATVTVPVDMDVADVADFINSAIRDADATAWEWDNFWLDHQEGLVGRDGDQTMTTYTDGEPI